jgi:hypothetical protein
VRVAISSGLAGFLTPRDCFHRSWELPPNSPESSCDPYCTDLQHLLKLLFFALSNATFSSIEEWRLYFNVL